MSNTTSQTTKTSSYGRDVAKAAGGAAAINAGAVGGLFVGIYVAANVINALENVKNRRSAKKKATA